MPSSSATGCIVEASSDAYRMRFSLSLPASTWWDSLRSTFSNLAGERSLCTSGYQIVDDGLCHLGNFSEHLLEKAVADDWASSIEASRLLCANKSRHVLFYNIHVPKAAGSSAEQTLSNIIREDAADIISPKRMDELRPGAFFMQIGNHASYADFMRGVPGFPGRLISTANCSDLETSCGPPLRANLKVVNGHASRWSRHHCSTRQTWLTTPVGAAAHSTACTRAHVHTCTRAHVHTYTRTHVHTCTRTCAPTHIMCACRHASRHTAPRLQGRYVESGRRQVYHDRRLRLRAHVCTALLECDLTAGAPGVHTHIHVRAHHAHAHACTRTYTRRCATCARRSSCSSPSRSRASRRPSSTDSACLARRRAALVRGT